MDYATALERLTVIIAILGSLGTAIGTFISARNQTKESDASTDRAKIFTPIDAAERISSISISLSQNLQTQLNECVARRDELIRLMNENSEQEIAEKIKLRKLVSRLRDIRERHDVLYHELQNNCPGFDILNSMLDAIITEIETELQEDK